MRCISTISLAFILGFGVLAQEPIRYTVTFAAPQTHYLEVAASIPAGSATLELFLPVWTPGSYLVREYSRNIEDFHARSQSGSELAWHKTRKNRWLIETAGAPRIDVSYKVYANDSSVQGNLVTAGFAMLNGAPNFMSIVGAAARPYEVRLILPAQWKVTATGMPGSGANQFTAPNYDILIDSPIYAGNAPVEEFTVDGKKHYLVNEGAGPMWDGPASAADVKKIVEVYARQWGGLPYDKYVFFNMLIESGGGLEHLNSTWMNSTKWAYGNAQEPSADSGPDDGRRRASRVDWLGLVSHEYFHCWNVKRLRPVELGPFDYENEVFTRSLWISEGFTSYYGDLGLRRAGLDSRDFFLREMGHTIADLQNAPGHLVQPVEASSFDAWIKLYRPDENSNNTTISYYTKGEIVGFLLDARLRKLSGGSKTLDDVMKLGISRYGGARGFTPDDFRKTASEVAGADLSSWFHSVLDTTEELDYSEALAWYGLRFKEEKPRPGAPAILTGISTKTDNGRLLVTEVKRGTPSYDAGVNVNDEIIAVNGYRVRAEQWPARLESYKAGETIQLLVARRGELITLDLPLAADTLKSWVLEADPGATAEQKEHLKAWLWE
jgi:predicted metalloprotease with PDZ domain